ncbi:MAG: nucleotide sugar dehydrogenase [Deltaproteobacteria bacterium]|nr:nucleotide sugar dehydrogenase [Deltaproteobacteria bacterium]
MKVGVMGAGRVGLASALVLCELGHDVTVFDVDPSRVRMLRAAAPPFFEPDAAASLQEATRSRRWTVTDRADALARCRSVLIAVPTPAGPGGQYDLAALRAAADALRGVQARTNRGLGWEGVFLRSTVLPGTTEGVLGTALADAAGGSLPPVPIGYLPEFLREGSMLADARRPDRIVVGAADAGLRALARVLFAGIDTTWFDTGIRTAELIKVANNALFSTCVSFANDIARLAETIDGVDAVEVFEGIHLDRRLQGSAGASIAEYLRPGPGFGGTCLPKDLAALAALAGARPEGAPILDAALRINRMQPTWFVERIAEALGGLADRRVLVLGLAFKPGTDDLRESVALTLCRELARRGAAVRAHDPWAEPGAARALLASSGVVVVENGAFRDAFASAEAAILVTPWPVYARTLPELLAMRSAPLLFADARGIFRNVTRARCVTYLGIGARPVRDERVG